MQSTIIKFMTYKVGIIGTGFGIKVHYPAFTAHPKFEVLAIAGNNYEKTENIAKELAIDAYKDWKVLVDREDLDVIAVTTPPFLHYEMGMYVLNSGKQLLLEKPTTSNAFEARKLLRTALNNGLVGMMAHEFRNVPVRAYMRDLIADGKIGKVRELHYISYASFAARTDTPRFGWLWDNIFDGGLLGAMGSHQTDLIRFILDENITEVQGSIYARVPKRMGSDDKLYKVTADDGYSMVFKTESGITGNLIVTTTLTKAPPSKFVVGGDKGTIYFENDDIYLSTGGEFEKLEIPEKYQLDNSLIEKDRRIPPFMSLLNSFADALDNGVANAPSLEDGWQNQLVLDALRESDRTGSIIKI